MNFEQVYNSCLHDLLYSAEEVDVGEWHAMDVRGHPNLLTHEMRHVTFDLHVPETLEELEEQYQPNLPWAREHFAERVSGEPLNPPPSHVRWPFAMKSNEVHLKDEKFSHTYPERYWPKFAAQSAAQRIWDLPRGGIRFKYGDLDDLVQLLEARPQTRQAYMPVWFPEDLTAARLGERCPCSIGYHFLIRDDAIHCDYMLRSCDFVRHFRDDMYFTARLMQWVRDQLIERGNYSYVMGDLVVHIASLHCMKGDLKKMSEEYDGLSDLA